MIPHLIAANWKMHKTPGEAETWANVFKDRLTHVPTDTNTGAEVLLCVPFVHLPALRTILADSPVYLGAQDVSAHDEGAYTGEVSAGMLADLGVSYVIVGHSERRAYHHEDDALVNEKLHRVLEGGMRPVLCVGETLEQREAGDAKEVVLAQLEAGLKGVEDLASLVVAYEPVWAIGTGKTATADDAGEMCSEIRRALEARFSGGTAVRILYGGSMKPANAAELLAQADINGGLIGSASLEVDSLLALVEAAGAARA